MTCRLQWYIKASWMLDTTSPTAGRVIRYVPSKLSFLLAFQYELTIWDIKWVLFNDDRVTVASEAEVLNADAYLLFYNLRTLATAATESWTVIVEILVWRGRSFDFFLLSFPYFLLPLIMGWEALSNIAYLVGTMLHSSTRSLYGKVEKGRALCCDFFGVVCCIVMDRRQE